VKFRTNITIDRKNYVFFKHQARDYVGSLSRYVNDMLTEMSSSWSAEKREYYASILEKKEEKDEGGNDD
jgi:hypothetical protein